MDKEKEEQLQDEIIKNFLAKDKVISEKANNTFDKFIDDMQNDRLELNKEVNSSKSDKYEENKDNVIDFGKAVKKSGIYRFKKLITIAASLVVVVVASNAYARAQGYDNIFFLIIDKVSPKEESNPEEIFNDRDITISYKSFSITDDVEMQINELQVKENTAKLYMHVKETKTSKDVPLNYKVLNEQNKTMYEGKSSKKENETSYTEVLELKNYKNDTNKIKLEIYNKDNILIKNVTIDLEKKTIEARTENQAVQKISQIDLNKFLKEETSKIYTQAELKDKQIIILETYDIYYSNGKYTVKYLFMMPTKEEFDKNEVEESQIYVNSAEFSYSNLEYKTIKIEKPEKF